MEQELERLYAENVEIKKRCEHYRHEYLRVTGRNPPGVGEREAELEKLKKELKEERKARGKAEAALNLARKERNEMLGEHNKRLEEVREAQRKTAMVAQVNMIMVAQLKHLDTDNAQLREEARKHEADKLELREEIRRLNQQLE